MREIIETGITVDEAIEKACAALGLAREDVSVEVLEMPVKKRLFSAGKPAKVKVTVDGEEQPKAQPVKQQPKAAAPLTEKKEKPVQNEEKKEAVYATSEKAQIAVEYLQNVSLAMGIENIEITAVKSGETTILKVEGENVGAMIGRRGETMEALSYLTGLAANREGGDYEKIGLDVAGYRSKRETDLIALAQRIGAKVAKTHRSQPLEPMNPYERRIIHSAISEMEGVKSESIGEGADRRIVISSTDPNAKQFTPKSGYRGGNNNRGGFKKGGNKGGYSKGGNHGPKREYAPKQGSQPKSESSTKQSTNKNMSMYGKIDL